MQKNNILIYSCFILSIFIILSMQAKAYDVNKIISYYNFERANSSSNITDNVGNYNIGSYGNNQVSNGIIGHGMTFNGVSEISGKSYSIVNQPHWSYNVWVYYLGSGAFTYVRFYNLSNSNYDLRISTEYNSYLYFMYTHPSPAKFDYIYPTPYTFSSNQWHMLTFVYNDSAMSPINLLAFYVDANLVYYKSENNLTERLDMIDLFSNDVNNSIDELSIWNQSLSNLDVNALYNYGSGLSLTTLQSSNATATTNFCINSTNLCRNGVTYQNGSYECYDIQHCLNSTQYGQSICTGTTPNAYCAISDNFTVTGNTFSARQCLFSTGRNYICNSSLYDPASNSFNCDLKDVQYCGQGCVETILDMNTSTRNFISTGKSCTTMISETIPFGYKLLCGPQSIWYKLVSTTDTQSINDLFSQCLTDGYTIVPTAQCSDYSLWTIINNTDTFYTAGECINQSAQPIGDLCDGQPENATRCADNNDIDKCVIGIDGYLYWNFTQDCSLLGYKYSCSGGQCTYNTGACRDDYDCSQGYFCASGTCQINGGIGCTSDLNCQSGQSCINNVCSKNNNLPPEYNANISDGVKIIIVFILMIVSIVCGFVVGRATNSMKLGVALGAILALMVVFAASMPSVPVIGGFIPIWIMVLIGIILILVFIFAGVKGLTGSGGSEGG